MSNIQQIIKTLRSKGYKVTPQRLAICEMILSSKNHPTANQIYKKVSQRFPTISLATVYQTLKLLVRLKLIQELRFLNVRYDPNTSPHIHIICPKCEDVYDYEDDRVRELWSRFTAELNFKPIGQRLEMYKYCEKCSKIE
ncbi:MAG: Fur family transcriptional regulator [Nitrososphaerota archaeon]|nr:Fur family transcriptional regulator [Nitrososphaerota archaeon]